MSEPTKSQLNAILHTGSDLLISAGAGSGKTSTVIERITRRILAGGDISRILVVTYTKAAASELKARISSRLAKEAQLNPKNTALSLQIVKMATADIGTIHSFCSKIIRPNFDKLSLDSNFRVGDDNEINIIKSEVMNEVLDYFYEQKDENEDFFIASDTLSSFTDEDKLAKALLELYGKLISTKESIKTLINNSSLNGDIMNSVYGDILKSQIKMFCEHYLKAYEYALSEIKTDKAISDRYLVSFAYDNDFLERLYRIYSTQTYDYIKEVIKGYEPIGLSGGALKTPVDKKFIKSIRDNFKDDLEKIEAYMSSSTSAIQNAFEQNKRVCSAIYSILQKFEVEFQNRKKALSVCDFNDLERYTLKILYNDDGSISETAKEISLLYDDIYIDEYQDTNSVQDAIFKAISRKNRFMVGDIKQSIYRFRSAEPEIFSSYRQNFAEFDEKIKNYDTGCTIFMSENFRCDEKIITFSNFVSKHMFSNSFGIPYQDEDNLIFKKGLPKEYVPQDVEICLLSDKKPQKNTISDEPDENFTQEDFVAFKIKEILSKGHLPNGVAVKASDIAILTGKNENFSKYTKALEKYGISSEYKEKEKFFEKPEILLILCILNTIDNPSRDEYLAGALRSDIFGFSLEDLIKIRACDNSKAGPSLFSSMKNYAADDETKAKIDKFLSTLDKIKKDTRKLSSHEIVSYIYEYTGILCLATESERKNLLKFYNYARKYESNSFKGLYSFLKYIDKISSKNIDDSDAASGENVKIMTMHTSKGLEFEVVFLCDTETHYDTRDSRAPIIFEKNIGINGYVSRKDGLVKFNTLMRKCAALAINKADAEEKMRLLYVAMTRAKAKLYITANVVEAMDKLELLKKEEKIFSPFMMYKCSSLIELILSAVHTDTDFAKIHTFLSRDDYKNMDEYPTSVLEEAADEGEYAAFKDMLERRLGFEYKYDYLSKIPSKLSVSRLYPEVLDGTENDYIKEVALDSVPKFLQDEDSIVSAADRGTATHTFMQFCDFDNLVQNGAENELVRLLENSYISSSTSKLINLDHIEKFVHSPLFSDIISSKKVLREFRFNVMLDASEFSNDERLKSEKVLVQGVCDCICEKENGDIVLIDYKTDYVTEQNYVEVLKERHSIQLLYYKKALELMFEKPISKVLIYSVPLAKTVEL